MSRTVQTVFGFIVAFAGLAIGYLGFRDGKLDAIEAGAMAFLTCLGGFFISKSLMRDFLARASQTVRRVRHSGPTPKP